MGHDRVYDYNNMIVIASAAFVCGTALLMSLVFLLLLFRRRRLDQRCRRPENMANTSHGLTSSYNWEEPQKRTVINEHQPNVIDEPKSGFRRHSNEHTVQATIETRPSPSDREKVPSTINTATPYHININEDHFLEVDVIATKKEIQDTRNIDEDKRDHGDIVEDVDTDSDYDATFETVVS